MDKQNPLSLLRVTTPNKQTLTFCDPLPRHLKKWVEGLPKANVGETARQLYQALIELNQLQTTSENRLQMLELLRPEVSFVCNQLEKHFLNQSIVLDERPRKVANLCQALQHHLAIGYKLIVTSLNGKASRDSQHLLAAALQRAIHSLCGPLIRATQLYCPVPEGLWLELHQLYQIARSQGLDKTVIRDTLANHTQGLSSEQSYLVALLLGSARCNQMRQYAIAQLAQVLELWSTQVVLRPGHATVSLFAVSPHKDAPPRYSTQLKAEEQADALGIDPSALVEAIHQHLQMGQELQEQSRLHVPASISQDMLQHLAAAWGDIAERSFQRINSQGTLTLCIGMSALHYYLAGQRTFSELLQQDALAQTAVFGPDGGAGKSDIWSGAFDARDNTDQNTLLPLEEIQYTKPADTGGKSPLYTQQHGSYPTHDVAIVNISPGGYCLSWPREVPSQLQAGELLGVQSAQQQDWSIAVVRWIRQVRGGGTQMGIELIAPQAQACGLQLLRNGEQGSQYMRALLLPEISVISRPASLITPRIPFQEGNRVNIRLSDAQHRALLQRRLSNTGSFNQFEYAITNAREEENDAQAPLTMPGHKSTAEDFDSLWKSL